MVRSDAKDHKLFYPGSSQCPELPGERRYEGETPYLNIHKGKAHQGERRVASITFKQSGGIEFPEHRDTWNDILAGC